MSLSLNSFGDLVSVLQLAWNLRAALSHAAGASGEITTLINDIDTFTRALQQTRTFIEQRRVPLQPAVENGIRHAIRTCDDILRRVLRKITSFRTRMARKVVGFAWRQYWEIAAWSILGGKKDVDSLRVQLNEQLNVIQLYLSLSQCRDQEAVQDAIERHATTLERLCTVAQDVQMRFDVGVPTFHFYDCAADRYYQPFARTSLHKAVPILESLGVGLHTQLPSEVELLQVHPSRNHFITRHTMHRLDIMRLPITLARLECFFFREHAFDEWQVLLGMPLFVKASPALMNILKHLVEHMHTSHTTCGIVSDGPERRYATCHTINQIQLLNFTSGAGFWWQDAPHVDEVEGLSHCL